MLRAFPFFLDLANRIAAGVELLRGQVDFPALNTHPRARLGLAEKHAVDDMARCCVAETNRAAGLLIRETGGALGERRGRCRRNALRDPFNRAGWLGQRRERGVRRCRAGGRREGTPRRGNCPSLAAVEAGILGR